MQVGRSFRALLIGSVLLGLLGMSTPSGGAVGATPTCLHRTATIAGSPRPDRIVGTEGDDVIAARGGDDVVLGLSGDDIICGGPGDDLLVGGPGDDTLAGGSGVDEIRGGAGADTLLGAAGPDRLMGGPGADRASGGADADEIIGGPGPDSLEGGDGRDSISGGADADRIDGGRAGDVIQGGDGPDTLLGGEGDDRLFGREGSDRCDGGSGTDSATGCEQVIATEIGQVPVPRFEPGPGQVALTFDDGPLPLYTPLILDVLARYDVPATFFVVGRSAEQLPGLLQRMRAEGHSVQNHTYDHAWLTRYSDTAVRSQLADTDRIIEAAIGVTPGCMRPPFGAVNDRIRSTSADLGLEVVMWDVDPWDWKLPGSGAVANHVIRYTGGGDIVLLHDGAGHGTIGALPRIIESLRDRGLEFVTLCDVSTPARGTGPRVTSTSQTGFPA